MTDVPATDTCDCTSGLGVACDVDDYKSRPFLSTGTSGVAGANVDNAVCAVFADHLVTELGLVEGAIGCTENGIELKATNLGWMGNRTVQTCDDVAAQVATAAGLDAGVLSCKHGNGVEGALYVDPGGDTPCSDAATAVGTLVSGNAIVCYSDGYLKLDNVPDTQMLVNGGWSAEGIADRAAHDAACQTAGDELSAAAGLDGHYIGCPYGDSYAGRVLPILSVASVREDAGCKQVAQALNNHLSIPAGSPEEIGCARMGDIRLAIGDFGDLVRGEAAGISAQLATCSRVAAKINARFGLGCAPMGCGAAPMCVGGLTCGAGTEEDSGQCLAIGSLVAASTGGSSGNTSLECGGHGGLTAAVAVLVILVVFLVAAIVYIVKNLGENGASSPFNAGFNELSVAAKGASRSVANSAYSNPAFSRGAASGSTVRLGGRKAAAQLRVQTHAEDESYEELSM
jgi:hypothetical protein